MLNTMLHPIDSLRRISSERDRKAQELEDSINDANDRVHDYGNSTFEDRYQAALELDKLHGEKQQNWVTREQFQEYDDEEVDAWQESERFRETMEAHRAEMAAYEQAEISEAIDQDREAVGIRLAEVYDELDDADNEDDGAIEALEDGLPREPLAVRNKPWNLDAGKSEVNKKATKPVGEVESSWDRVRTGTGEKKPGKGIVEGVKSWFKMMFGKSEKK